MYGLINKALRSMITEQHGEQCWQRVLEHSGVAQDSFVTMKTYDDAVTYSLAGAASEVLGAPVEDCLEAFGHYWIASTAPQQYGELLDFVGSDAIGFLENVNRLHDRITSTFTGYRPPDMELTRREDGRAQLRYSSHRIGLTPFVNGLLRGIGDRFATPVTIESMETSRSASGETTCYVLRFG